MYNSTTGANKDEGDLTMIDQDYIYGNNDGPTSDSIVRRMQQANHSASAKCAKNKKSYDERDAYVYVEHDRYEAARQIEQILNFYRQDLKQETNTQLDCNQRLMTRLIDFLRPVFSTNETKMKDLDILYEEISDSQDIRFIEQKEKVEQLNNEVAHLKKLIITSPSDTNRSNPVTKAYQINSMANYDQWVELEEEAKRLQQLVETQRNRINELVKLLLPEDEPSTDNRPPITTNSNRQPTGTVDNNPKRPTVPARNPPVLSRAPSSATEVDIDEHMERCIPASDNTSTRSELQTCPYCEQQFPANDKTYIQHLTNCLNERATTF